MHDKYTDDAFVEAYSRCFCLNSALHPNLLIVGLNPSLLADQTFDNRTPCGKMVKSFIELAEHEHGIIPLVWNIAPGVTFQRHHADVSVDVVLQECISSPDEFAPVFQLVRLGLGFFEQIPCLVSSVRRILALGEFVADVLRSSARTWPSGMQVLSYVHPGFALRKQEHDSGASDAWIRGAVACVANVYDSRNSKKSNNLTYEVAISMLAAGRGPNSFTQKLSVSGIIVRSHCFQHGGGSVRLCDGTSFIDVKFIGGACPKFASVCDQKGRRIKVSGFKVLKRWKCLQRRRVPAAPWRTGSETSQVHLNSIAWLMVVGQLS